MKKKFLPLLMIGRISLKIFYASIICFAALSGCSDDSKGVYLIVVNSLEDKAEIFENEITLRHAIDKISSGGTIVFDPELDGGVIELEIVGEENSILTGEAFDGGTFLGYIERNYGPSALYARKNLTIDASDLNEGIHLKWTGGEENPARVLAVYGDLTLLNITITGGYSKGIELNGNPVQPFALARGGGVAVWGHAILKNCTIGGNTLSGDLDPGRDRGAFGGGVYADLLTIEDSIISGNRVAGYGAAGGGVYSVGGAGFSSGGSVIRRTAVTGNRISGLHSYGGGGVYMSNGYLSVFSCTIAENRVAGREAVFNNRTNIGGGGIATTIGDAHDVEDIRLQHSIVVGNTLNGEPEDIFTGSLMHFYSRGYNLVGGIDFSYILVPVPLWNSLSRRHWPKTGDFEGINIGDVLDLNGVVRHDFIVSHCTEDGQDEQNAVLWYPGKGEALNKIPSGDYVINHVLGQAVRSSDYSSLQEDVLHKLEAYYSDELGEGFADDFIENLEDGLLESEFHGPAYTWPRNNDNIPWISFWKELDLAIDGRIGDAGMSDEFWESFIDDKEYLQKTIHQHTAGLSSTDQLNKPRPPGDSGDIGAVEMSN